MRKQADALKVYPIPDACLLVMAQRPSRLLGLPETRSLIFLIKNSPDQVEGYLDYLQPMRHLDQLVLTCLFLHHYCFHHAITITTTVTTFALAEALTCVTATL
jgi:hypothetical protein